MQADGTTSGDTRSKLRAIASDELVEVIEHDKIHESGQELNTPATSESIVMVLSPEKRNLRG